MLILEIPNSLSTDQTYITYLGATLLKRKVNMIIKVIVIKVKVYCTYQFSNYDCHILTFFGTNILNVYLIYFFSYENLKPNQVQN